MLSLHLNSQIHTELYQNAPLAKYSHEHFGYVLSEYKQVHYVLKWQQPNIPAAVCVINVNQTTNEKERITILDWIT